MEAIKMTDEFECGILGGMKTKDDCYDCEVDECADAKTIESEVEKPKCPRCNMVGKKLTEWQYKCYDCYQIYNPKVKRTDEELLSEAEEFAAIIDAIAESRKPKKVKKIKKKKVKLNAILI